MINVTRIGHLTLETPDVPRLAAYYQDVLEFAEAGREGDRRFLATDVTHHAVTLAPGDAARLARITLQVDAPDGLDALRPELERHGVASELQSDPEPGIAEQLLIHDPDGNELALHAGAAIGERLPAAGVRPQKLGHVCYFVEDVQQTVRFYEDVLGFRFSDGLGDFFVFLRCNTDHHTINLLKSPKNRRLHHIGYELRDFAHVQLACDQLDRCDHPLVWGPGRHGPGHNVFTYHRDPDGNVVELFCQLDQMSDEALGYFDPRPWHQDAPQRPKVWAPGPRVPNTWGPLPPEGFLE